MDVHSQAWGCTFEALPTMPCAFTAASFEEGNMAKRHKLEVKLDKFSEPNQLSGPSLEAKVHCVVTAMNDSKGHSYQASTARSLMGRPFTGVR